MKNILLILILLLVISCDNSIYQYVYYNGSDEYCIETESRLMMNNKFVYHTNICGSVKYVDSIKGAEYEKAKLIISKKLKERNEREKIVYKNLKKLDKSYIMEEYWQITVLLDVVLGFVLAIIFAIYYGLERKAPIVVYTIAFILFINSIICFILVIF